MRLEKLWCSQLGHLLRQYLVVLPLFVPMVGVAKEVAPKGCHKEPLEYVLAKKDPKAAYSCRQNQASFICPKKLKDLKCRHVETDEAKEQLAQISKKFSQSPQGEILSFYMTLMDWRGPVRKAKAFSLQTGDYPALSIPAKGSPKTPCFREILQAAYQLKLSFPNFNFRFEDGIEQCKYLLNGVDEIVAQVEKVRKNVARINSPMHTIFFSNKTRFNHYILGEIGLHININKKGELKRRLIDFKIDESSIPHENNGRG